MAVLSTPRVAALATLLFSGAWATTTQFVMYTPRGDDPAVERMDNILTPGAIAAHVHQIFGASGMSPDMTYDSLQSSDCTTVGAANGFANSDDNSVYWHPALYMDAKDGSGYIRIPTNGHKLYYRDMGNAADKKREPFEFPKGFRMIAGVNEQRVAFPKGQQSITEWICHTDSNWPQGMDGGFPKDVTDCPDYPGFNGAINFPHCWNGNDFDQANPTAHMAYPANDVQNGPCPSTHPIRLPHIFVENEFDLHKMVDKVVPNTFTLAQGDKTGYGWHMDFFNGWKEGALSTLLNQGSMGTGGCPVPFYGNEDVGVCPAFHASKVQTSTCKMNSHFKENVDTPGKFLPGCNPISNVSPAPKMAIAALGVATDQCAAAGSGGSSASAASSSVATSSATTAPAYSAASSQTTLATVVKPSTTTSASTSTSSSDALCPGKDGQTFTDPKSLKAFVIECGTDRFQGDLTMQFVSGGLPDCIAACAKNDKCVDVALAGSACYLKKSLGNKVASKNVNGARLCGDANCGVKASTTTTAATSTTTAAAQLPAAYGNHAAGTDHGGKDVLAVVTVTSTQDDLVQVTQWVTVYARDAAAEATPAPAVARRHGHLGMHMRHAAAKGGM